MINLYTCVCVCLGRVLEASHSSYVETVPYKAIILFTLLQCLYFALCFGVTWVPVGGILFPLPFFLLIVIRERVLPRIFSAHDLQELDSSEYDEVAGHPAEAPESEEISDDFFDAEILDEMTTHRGEMKHRTSFHIEDKH